jgi:multiple sugar transport system permease protein
MTSTTSQSLQPDPAQKAKGINLSPRKILLLLAVLLVVVFCLAPVLRQVLTSFKPNRDISAIPTIYFPTQATLNHYLDYSPVARSGVTYSIALSSRSLLRLFP